MTALASAVIPGADESTVRKRRRSRITRIRTPEGGRADRSHLAEAPSRPTADAGRRQPRGAFSPRDREGDCPMIRRHRQNARPAPAVAANRTTPFDDFHEWVLSLPWVVERPVDPENPEMRSFAVDCEPLG